MQSQDPRALLNLLELIGRAGAKALALRLLMVTVLAVVGGRGNQPLRLEALERT